MPLAQFLAGSESSSNTGSVFVKGGENGDRKLARSRRAARTRSRLHIGCFRPRLRKDRSAIEFIPAECQCKCRWLNMIDSLSGEVFHVQNCISFLCACSGVSTLGEAANSWSESTVARNYRNRFLRQKFEISVGRDAS